MIVMKFGGSSVADAERIRQMGRIVLSQLNRQPVVVLSAMGDTTDQLLDAAKEALDKGLVSIDIIEELHNIAISDLNLGPEVQDSVKPLFEELRSLLTGISLIRELTGRTRDYLVSFGERLSVRIAAAYFGTLNVPARALDAWDAGLLSDSNYTAAELLPECGEGIRRSLKPLSDSGTLPVVTGFIARDEKGNITTLGRGGSDLSASTIAAACGVEEAQFWKDVDGILTADPRLVTKARPVESVTYEEAAELAYFGAQVLHPRAMLPCMKTETPVLVKNSFNLNAPGTRIVARLDKKTGPVRAITSRKKVTLVDIVSSRMLGQPGFLEEVFSSFAKYGISVDMVATSEVSVSLTLDAVHDLEALRKDLSRIASVEIKTGKAIVTIVGDVRRSSEILRRAFGVCANRGVQVQMVSQGASKVNISFIVNDIQAADVVRELHANFFEVSPNPGGPDRPGDRPDGEDQK
ncbi:MAG: aspartate kinase [Spirochaetaceae bacterium]|jgi:aspartate kinase|nr:aspartate kinase [Spirochaetaceae bacterium]